MIFILLVDSYAHTHCPVAAPIVRCTTCGEDHCFTHKVQWTDGHACKTYGTTAGAKFGANQRPCPQCNKYVSP